MALLVLLAGVLGCRPRPDAAVVAVALTNWSREVIEVVQAELAEWPARGLPRVTLYVAEPPTDVPVNVDVALAEQIAARGDVVGVVGHGGSREALAAAPVYNDAGIPQIVPTGTSRRLKDAGDWTFMLAPDDSVEGEFIAEFVVRRLEARRVSIFFVNDEYGTGLRDGGRAAIARLGGTVLVEMPIDETSDVATLVSAAYRRGRPDAVIAAARHRATGGIASRVRALSPGVPIVAGDGAYPPRHLAAEAGPNAATIYVVAFWLDTAPDSLSRAFVERWQRHATRPPSSADAMAYDAMMLLATAAREVGPAPAAVRDYLQRLGDDLPPYRGVTGEITFREGRPARLAMARLEGTRFVAATPP